MSGEAKPAPTYIVCPTCGNGYFLQSRRIYTIPYANSTDLSRNWAVAENDSGNIVCAKDGTRLRWNPATQSYDINNS